jgi:hypothetical protein
MYVYVPYPDMGGEKWYNQYDALLRKVQRLLGAREQGVKAFEGKSSG